ncbi:Uncharacterised protein [Burkholderia pseudomallei]|nr:Uncharacterised protein [Burkholderia pseudomallei]
MPEQSESPSGQWRPAIDCQGGHWEVNPDGSYAVTLPGVASVHCSHDGDIEAQAPAIRAVTIADLSKVVKHSITRLYDTVSHTVHLEGGGVVSYLHGSDGSGYEFNCRNVVFEICESGQVLVLGTCEPQ